LTPLTLLARAACCKHPIPLVAEPPPLTRPQTDPEQGPVGLLVPTVDDLAFEPPPPPTFEAEFDAEHAAVAVVVSRYCGVLCCGVGGVVMWLRGDGEAGGERRVSPLHCPHLTPPSPLTLSAPDLLSLL
jgi:hypothetical protein